MKKSQKIGQAFALAACCAALLCGCAANETADAARETGAATVPPFSAANQTETNRISVETRAEDAANTPFSLSGAEEEGIVFHYEIRDGNAVVIGAEHVPPILVIPDTLDGYPVTGIGERAFEEAPLAAVVLPESTVSVGWFAFYGCRSLVSVTIPLGVSEIGYDAFAECPAVTIVCEEGSFAARYAESYGLSHFSPAE